MVRRNTLGEAVAATLIDEGFRVDRAENGEEAMARVRQQHYDVIICDLKMPKVDGMERLPLDREAVQAARSRPRRARDTRLTTLRRGAAAVLAAGCATGCVTFRTLVRVAAALTSADFRRVMARA